MLKENAALGVVYDEDAIVPGLTMDGDGDSGGTPRPGPAPHPAPPPGPPANEDPIGRRQ